MEHSGGNVLLAIEKKIRGLRREVEWEMSHLH